MSTKSHNQNLLCDFVKLIHLIPFQTYPESKP